MRQVIKKLFDIFNKLWLLHPTTAFTLYLIYFYTDSTIYYYGAIFTAILTALSIVINIIIGKAYRFAILLPLLLTFGGLIYLIVSFTSLFYLISGWVGDTPNELSSEEKLKINNAIIVTDNADIVTIRQDSILIDSIKGVPYNGVISVYKDNMEKLLKSRVGLLYFIDGKQYGLIYKDRKYYDLSPFLKVKKWRIEDRNSTNEYLHHEKYKVSFERMIDRDAIIYYHEGRYDIRNYCIKDEYYKCIYLICKTESGQYYRQEIIIDIDGLVCYVYRNNFTNNKWETYYSFSSTFGSYGLGDEDFSMNINDYLTTKYDAYTDYISKLKVVNEKCYMTDSLKNLFFKDGQIELGFKH